MDPLWAGVLGLMAIFVLVVLGMRIAFATALVGLVGMWYMKNLSVAAKVIGFLPHGIVAHYSLSVVPLFIIMGYYAYYAGLTDDIFFTARQWVGHLPQPSWARWLFLR